MWFTHGAPAFPATLALLAGLAWPSTALAADGAEHHHHASPSAASASAPAAGAMSMSSALGPYPMTRDASGTSWQPDAAPMTGLHVHGDPWTLMLHGSVAVVYDHQGGRRGDVKTFAQSMAMGMAWRPLGPGVVGLRAMVSLDPAMGRRGYPLLLQSGETADGRRHLVDRQHPHDFFMELSSSYALPLGGGASGFVYAGLPGEPALGPTAYMHRASASRNPETPLTHHWLDSTHIAFGVVTLGASRGGWKLEGSGFNGREPDERRWNVETRRLDSAALRLSWNPSPAWSMQLSHGYLKSPERLEPELHVHRTTASATWQAGAAGVDVATTLAWGQNRRRGGEHAATRPGQLLESQAVAGRHTVFGRIEQVKNDELFEDDDPLHGRAFRVRKFQLGYVFDVARAGPATWGVGVSVAAFDTPRALDDAYGRRPRAYLLFLQGRL